MIILKVEYKFSVDGRHGVEQNRAMMLLFNHSTELHPFCAYFSGGMECGNTKRMFRCHFTVCDGTLMVEKRS